MERTRKLYYEEPGLFEAEASVVAVEGDPASPAIVLDGSLFYPEGGGQPCDLGSIAGLEVAAVTEEGGRILHALAGPLPSGLGLRVGSRVALAVDSQRRLDFSQQHSAQHLLSAAFMRLLGAATVSVHLGRERCLIDFDAPALADEDVAKAEELVERAIAEDRAIRVHRCPPEDLASFQLRKRPPAGEEEVRVVEIEGLDFTPCCGTHLASAGRLRLVRVLGTEKYKGMTRLTFVSGARAAADYKEVSLIARQAARALGSSVPELPAAAAREAALRQSLERSNVALLRERAALEAREALGGIAARAGSAPLVSRRFADRDAASLMESAKALAAGGATALLSSVPELTAQALAPAADARLGERLKPLLTASGSRGGGGPSSFRAVFPDLGSLDRFMAAAGEELGGGNSA